MLNYPSNVLAKFANFDFALVVSWNFYFKLWFSEETFQLVITNSNEDLYLL